MEKETQRRRWKSKRREAMKEIKNKYTNDPLPSHFIEETLG
jgi:hypothetical protein